MTPFDKQDIRPPVQGKGDTAQKPMPVESVRFNFPTRGKVCTLNIADFTSGQAMIDAAQEWAAKQ